MEQTDHLRCLVRVWLTCRYNLFNTWRVGGYLGAGQGTSQEGGQRSKLVTDHTQKMDLSKSIASTVHKYGQHEIDFV